MQNNFEFIYSLERIEEFISKYPNQLCKDFKIGNIKCGIIKSDEIEIASELIRRGELIAFPTETVYGLGANATDEKAIRSIFTTKKRPLTDPIIVHVHQSDQIKQYVKSNEIEKLKLGQEFWPGPFTLILKADQQQFETQSILSADTGYVGFRIPRNQIALELLKKSGLLIAAPSANLFSHVSPTSPIHVFNDFYDQRIHIIDGPICDAGIESTVVQIKENQNLINVYRRGSLQIYQLREVLENFDQYRDFQVVDKQKKAHESDKMIAPGQLLKHYSPNIETYILRFETLDDESLCQEVEINNAIIVDIGDFAKSQINMKKQDIQFLSLCQNQIKEAYKNLYNVLRLSENQYVDIIMLQDICQVYNDPNNDDDEIQTLKDKLFRAASGKYIFYDQVKQLFYFS